MLLHLEKDYLDVYVYLDIYDHKLQAEIFQFMCVFCFFVCLKLTSKKEDCYLHAMPLEMGKI